MPTLQDNAIKLHPKQDLQQSEAIQLYYMARQSPFEACWAAYKLGFARGQNSIRNQRKRKAPASVAPLTEAGPTKTN